ncbi:hydroxymethylbilane synthase [Halorussus sp. MSC15.2]|uniref:hydroxymethylbilane synthase n=1 Tax=Halorussus sp. MSC15.2 TaxID=2283638 RepID=UPI0013D3F124|nr:hydroxymethylbilane synthase [Halorussus sp. MSC15.2]NEU59066.1 hydroxymethylbilane synthase [Halorussus sp. MSC15.2]
MSKHGTEIRLATRGSDLALRQAAEVKAALEDRRFDVELVEVETTGDEIRDELIHRLGKTGAFVRSLDEKVLSGELDGAIHSMKDMPTDSPEELVVAAIPERASANDVLITPDGTELDELPEGATVGTSSLRRKAQLLNYRDDLNVEPLRGNVDTRAEKLLAPALQREHEERTQAEKEKQSDKAMAQKGHKKEYEGEFDRTVEEWFNDLAEVERRALEREVETEYDAIVLAQAGLERSGLAHHLDYVELPSSQFVPAPGQGALALTALDSELAGDVNTVLDHPRTRVETTVERTILAELGGGCVAPIGVHGLIQGENVHVDVQVFSQDGTEVIEASRDVPVENHVSAAKEFAADLAEQGADDLIEAAKADDEERESKRGESVHQEDE